VTSEPTRVLIAEDEALIRLDLKEMLEEEGYVVVAEVGDGQAAVEQAQQLRPDLVVLDVQMPVLDGIAAAEQIAADAGVSLRTFYRHFASKHDLLFADYAGLQWFRAALAARDRAEPIIESVHSAIMARPYDDWAVAQTAALRAQEVEPGRIARHMRQVEADFADSGEPAQHGELG